MEMKRDDSAGGSLYFGVDARHIRQLGQQLVGDRITAVSELIKNAYDADATKVIIEFVDAHGGPGGELTIRDDGSGMDLETIERSWMRISSDDKEQNPLSPTYRRSRAGRKGIGRFSAESLGEHLVLRTSQQGQPLAIEARFDWEHAYSAGADLTKVPNPWRAFRTSANEHGTTLLISNLHDPWTQAQRTRVMRSVTLLQPPFPVQKIATGVDDPGFRVEVLVDGVRQKAPGGLEDFLAGATAQITGGVAADGEAWFRVTSERLGLDVLEHIDRGSANCGPFSIEAAYFVYKSDAIGVPVRVAQEMAKQFSGMRVYRDGLRLLPYGEQEDDWLGLNELYRSRSRTLAPVGRDNFYGQVTIGRQSNPLLLDTSSREGLLRNNAFSEMVEIVHEVLVRAAIAVATKRRAARREPARRPPTRQEVLREASNVVTFAMREALPKQDADKVVALVEAALETTTSTAGEADRVDKAATASLLEEIELLRILASLGTSISVFSHEVRSTINANSIALAVLSKSANPNELETAREAAERLGDLAGYIDRYSSASQRRVRAPQPLFAVLDDFRLKFAEPLARQVKTSIRVQPRHLRTLAMGRTALDAILINLFTNAVKALDREGQAVREILLEATAEDGLVLLRVEDTGVGVSAALRDRIFEPFVTSSGLGESELGVGTGLGLKIVRDLLEEYGGSIELAEPSIGFTTAFEVRLPSDA